MALTKAAVKRTQVTTGDDFRTLNDGTGALAQGVVALDANGDPIAYGTNYSSAAAEDSHAFTGDTALGEVLATLDDPLTGTATCAMVFSGITALPANGTAPTWRIPIRDGVGGYSFPTGLAVTTGYVVALSSTNDTLTVTTASEGLINVRRL